MAMVVLVAQELNMDDLIGLLALCSALFFVIVAGALGIGLGRIIFVWCGVL